MIYLSGHVGDMRHPRLGFIMTFRRGLRQRIPDDAAFAADNGCFTASNNYSDDGYLRFLDQLPVDRCLFATAPDVVGDHAATVERSLPMLRRIRAAGFPVAFIAQDGWSEETTPWDEFDALFVGGTTEFKFRGGRLAVHAARQRGKRTHMGRVNSLDRLAAAAAIGCDSADGTFLRFGPDVNTPRLFAWLDRLTREPMLIDALRVPIAAALPVDDYVDEMGELAIRAGRIEMLASALVHHGLQGLQHFLSVRNARAFDVFNRRKQGGFRVHRVELLHPHRSDWRGFPYIRA